MATVTPTPTKRFANPFIRIQGNMVNIWQRANGELWMHSYYQNKADAVKGQQRWTDPAKLETTLSAINNTPIAATAWASNNYFVSIQSIDTETTRLNSTRIGNPHTLHSTITKHTDLAHLPLRTKRHFM